MSGTLARTRRAARLPDLPRPAWTVLAADAVTALGTGMTVPYLLVYFHSVRGIPLTVAGPAVSMTAVGSLAGNPVGGALADRRTPRFALVFGLCLAAVGIASVVLVRASWEAFAAALLLGFGAGIILPSQDTLLATTVDADSRSAAFSVRFVTMNAGLGIGALVASLIVTLHSGRSFETIYAVNGVTYLAAIPLLMFIRAPVHLPADAEASPEIGMSASVGTSSGYLDLLKDRTFRRVLVLTFVTITVSYGQFASGFPAFATRPGGISAHALSLAYAANTITIVVAQLAVLRALENRRRTRGLALACACWAGCWGVTLLSGHVHSRTGAVAGFIVAMIIFGAGETFLTPTLTPLVNDLAPDHLRGRYNGANTLAFTCGFLVGPAAAGTALGLGAGNVLFFGLIGGCGVAAATAIALERHLPSTANTIPPTRPADCDEPPLVAVAFEAEGPVSASRER